MNPRRLPFFVESLGKLDYVDVLLAKNMEIIMAQNNIRKYFLEHDYTHLLFTSDDVEIPYGAPKQIFDDVEQGGYDIITGWSLCRPNRKEANITPMAPKNIGGRLNRPFWYHEYGFLKNYEISNMVKSGKTIIPIWFTGWSLTCISRKVVDVWTPRGWYFQPIPEFRPTIYKGVGGSWASTDLWFSYQLWKAGFNKYADLRVYVPHNPLHFSHKYASILVGKEPAKLEFISAKKALR